MPDFTELLAKLEDPDTPDYRQEAAQAIRELQEEVARLGAMPTLTTRRSGKTLTVAEWHARELHHFEVELELDVLRRCVAAARAILDRRMQLGDSTMGFVDGVLRDLRTTVTDGSRGAVLDKALDLEAARRGGVFEALSNARKSRALEAEARVEALVGGIRQQRVALLGLVHDQSPRRTQLGYTIAALKRVLYPITDALHELQEQYVSDKSIYPEGQS